MSRTKLRTNPKTVVCLLTIAGLQGATLLMAAPTSGEVLTVKPYQLPRDVFDLPYFDQFRQNGTLDVARAQAGLEALSDGDLPAAQTLFDLFSWKVFIALNWPANADGEADPKGTFGDSQRPKVWESWIGSSEIFKADGSKPREWSGKPAAAKLDHWKAGWRQHSTVDQGKQAFSGPLVDQRGNWLHYQALINHTEYDYLVRNELYNLEGQAHFTNENIIEFPIDTAEKPGAIELKFAWKRLTKDDDESRYLVREFPVVTYRPPGAGVAPDEGLKTGKADPNAPAKPVKLGLVGMHVAMRTVSSPQWIWATFEHIDNTRVDKSTVKKGHAVPMPSLSRPDDPFALLGANMLPATNAGPKDATGAFTDWDETIPMNPVEVLRLVPPPTATAEVNSIAQSLLGGKNSALEYYELIGTQWPTHPKAPAVAGGQGSAPESISRKMPGQVVPVYLVNTTMETYFQKGFQEAGPLEQDDRVPFSIDTTNVFGTESCVGCHYSAGACLGFRKDSAGKFLRDASGNKLPIFGENAHGGRSANANFSWLLQIEAKSKEKPEPAAPASRGP
jgi:hypothetical protein